MLKTRYEDMKNREIVKNDLLQWAFDNFSKTSRCNGLNSESIRYNYSNEDLQELIIELLKEDKVSLIAAEHDINPSIIRVGFVSKEQQIEYVKKNGIGGDFCIYPSKTHLIQHYVESDLVPRLPFNKMLKLGTPHNEILYFEWGTLFKYYSDPRYDFDFSDYTGHIFSSERLNEERRFAIKTFGVGKNKNGEHVVAVPLSELVNMPSACQIEWYGMLEPEQEKCAVLNNYVDVLNGCWNFKDTIFRSILKELSNINKLTTTIWECSFYRKEYIEDKPVGFDLLYLPTKSVFLEFVSLFEKIVVQNINNDFFVSVGVVQENDKEKKDKTLQCLKEWLTIVAPSLLNIIHSAFYDLRKKRQEPAHVISENEYDMNFFVEQNVLLEKIFKALNSLRMLIQSHPDAKSVVIPFINTEKYLII